MSTTEIRQQIVAILKKLGPSAPRVIVDAIGSTESKIGYHLREMVADKLLKATGTSNDRAYALPEQRLAGTSSHAKKKNQTQKPAARAAAAATILPAMTEDMRMVLVYEDGQAPHIFSATETQAIADLILTHYEA